MSSHFRSLFIALSLMLLSPLSAFAQENACTSAEECWTMKRDKERLAVWIADLSIQEGYPLSAQIMKYGSQSSETMIIRIPLRAVNENCEGLNSLRFAINGRSSFATGKVSGLEGQAIKNLFADYKGRASGAAFLGGRGKWSIRNEQGITISDQVIALPVPTLGGDLAMGVTACDVSLSLEPSAQSLIQVNRSRENREKIQVPTEQVLEWLF